MTYGDLNNFYIFLTKVMKLIWFGLFGYLLVAWLAPSMSFWTTLGSIAQIVFVDATNNIFGFFNEYAESVSSLYVYGDSSTRWAQITGGFLNLVSLGAVLAYYILLLFIFLTSIGYEETNADPWLENEIDWLMGVGTTEDHKQAQIQAKAIAAELNRSK